jgi:hypothetical protein
MPVVAEMMHPNGFSFGEQRKIYVLRQHDKLPFTKIAKQVRNLKNKTPRPRLVSEYYHKLNKKFGRARSQYHKCGMTVTKATPEVIRFSVRRLLQKRAKCVCTSTLLQQLLAREMGVALTAAYIRKILNKKGYKWLPRRQKRKYSKEVREERLKFARKVLRMTVAELRNVDLFFMDGKIVPMPPTDPTERLNFCKYGESHMWRKKTEGFKAELAGDDEYGNQVPLARAVPLWGGCSAGGFSVVLFHKKKKLNTGEWVSAVKAGKLTSAAKSLKAKKAGGLINVLCDNESFLRTKDSTKAHKAAKVVLWKIPAKSPDLNPVEKFWAWLGKKLRSMDLADAVAKRPVLSKVAYRERVRRVVKSKKAQEAASNIALGLRKVCREVVAKKGHATKG